MLIGHIATNLDLSTRQSVPLKNTEICLSITVREDQFPKEQSNIEMLTERDKMQGGWEIESAMILDQKT